ncbi:unnamed protein product [Vicia faba]|uniref:Uncharacterized protein n=1 Tax=Vicia faba TaxID=3906 RepID=A0AAV0ZY08_VICFA|nr:unnamed protein product [Vicia faba]
MCGISSSLLFLSRDAASPFHTTSIHSTPSVAGSDSVNSLLHQPLGVLTSSLLFDSDATVNQKALIDLHRIFNFPRQTPFQASSLRINSPSSSLNSSFMILYQFVAVVSFSLLSFVISV